MTTSEKLRNVMSHNNNELEIYRCFIGTEFATFVFAISLTYGFCFVQFPKIMIDFPLNLNIT